MKKLTIISLLSVFILVIFSLVCSAKQSVKFNPIDEIIYPYTDEVKNYLQADFERLPREFVNKDAYDNYKDNPISWTFTGEGLEKYIFEISVTADFSNSKRFEFEKKQNIFVLSNLLKGQKYYVRITAVTESGNYSDTASFTTTSLGPRVFGIGSEMRGNYRDMGGYVTADGNYIPQNLILRGAAIDDGSKRGGVAISENGLDFLNNEFKPKLEIDLRNSTEQNGRTTSEITDTRYVNYPITQYQGAFYSSQAELYRDVIREFANRDNYPIYFHCAAGADRTGTIGAILESLLNYKHEDLIHDYELSSFYQVGLRERFDIERVTGEFEEWPGNESCDRQKGAELYLKFIGVTDTEIKQIKAILYGWAKNEFPFADVTESDYFFESVFRAREKNVTAGIGNSLFAPYEGCTRAQIVTFLWKANGAEKVTDINMPFSDVAKDSYYYYAVLWAYKNGIISGVSAKSFSPDEVCTRAQSITMLWRLCKSPDSESEASFTDVPSDSWYFNAVKWAAENKITSGTLKGCFSPEQICQRAQIITFIYSALWK